MYWRNQLVRDKTPPPDHPWNAQCLRDADAPEMLLAQGLGSLSVLGWIHGWVESGSV
jgi:hypothetical protein